MTGNFDVDSTASKSKYFVRAPVIQLMMVLWWSNRDIGDHCGTLVGQSDIDDNICGAMGYW